MSDPGFAKEYYDKRWSLTRSPSPQEEQRINETVSLVPEDCVSILDAGCGDGRVTNHLMTGYRRVVGLERSKQALATVKVPKVLGSIEALPFQDRSFDLVLCCEVLEHLPFNVYVDALRELERVAGTYIIVTVPNKEDIRGKLVTCPHCGCVFHPSRHVRSFSVKTMLCLFSQFTVQSFKICRPMVRQYPLFLIKIARVLGLHPAFPPFALCPQCGYTTPASSCGTDSALRSPLSHGPAINLLRCLVSRVVPTKMANGWLMVLYRREQVA